MRNVQNFFLFFIALNFILMYGCNDTETVEPPVNSEQFGPYWEMHIASDSLITHHYGFELAVSNGQITGNAEILDTNDRHNGTVSGTIVGDSIKATVDFLLNIYDFKFSGSKSNSIISGKLIFTGLAESAQDTLDVNLVNTLNYALSFGEPSPPNPYLFKTIYSTSSPSGPPVIFVHGMGGRLEVWDSLLSRLTPEFKSRHNVYAYQYNWQDSVMINGRVLRDSVAANNLIDPIIVAHSMGGLVSRAYIASGGEITKLVTLGTPHLGSALANALFIRADLNTPGPKDMKPNGQFITDMKTNTVDVAHRNKYYCIAGRMGGHYDSTSRQWIWNEPYYKDIQNGIVCIGWRLLLPYGNNDGLVNEWSSLFEGGGINLVFKSPQLYIDHQHLIYPGVAPNIENYINGL